MQELGPNSISKLCALLITPSTIVGGKNFKVILDAFSFIVVMKMLKNENEARNNLINFVQELLIQDNIAVNRFGFDNGDEYSLCIFKSFCK